MDTKRDIIALIEALFVNRKDIHSRQRDDGRYFKVAEPIDEDLLARHLSGEVTAAAYQLLDYTVRFACFDIDILKSEIIKLKDQGMDNDRIFQHFWPALKEQGQKIVAELKNRGFDRAIAVEPSGYRGVHIYLLVEPTKASIAKSLGESVLTPVGEPPAGLEVELFPKQTRSGAGPGYALKLPLGIHMVTNKRSFFIDPETFTDTTGADCYDEKFWLKQLKILEAVVPARIETPGTEIVKPKSAPPVVVGSEAGDGLLKTAVNNCLWLRNIEDRARKNHHLTHDERFAITSNLLSFGEDGKAAIHKIISLCSDYSLEHTTYQIQQIESKDYRYPVSCKKLCPDIQCDRIKKIQGRTPADAVRAALNGGSGGDGGYNGGDGDNGGRRGGDRQETCLESYHNTASAIMGIRRNNEKPYLQDFEINNRVARLILDFLGARGIFYTDNRDVYFFDNEVKKLIRVNREDNNFLIMVGHLGIYPSEFIHRFVEDFLFLHILEHGVRTEIYNMAYYDQESFVLYISNYDNQVYRITMDKIELVDNGTDGILFISDAKYQTYNVDISNKPDDMPLFEEYIVSKINFIEDRLTPDERRVLLRNWFYSMFFESMAPTKSIIAFIGRMGSGKSSTLRKIGTLLYGSKFQVMPLTEDSKDFDAAITNSDFVAIDNADSKVKWLDDRLAVAATGGTIKKRELYTTNRLVDFPVRCFIGITSRTPHFRREDIADRLLMMKVERFDKFVSEKSLLSEVLDNRDRIMTEVIYRLQEIIRALYETRDEVFEIDFRMADFAQFCLRIARHEGNEDEVRAIFRKLTQEQNIFSLEDDPIFKLLSAWVEVNGGREITSADLCRELSEIAKRTNVVFPYDGQNRSFAQRLPSLIPSLEEFFIVSQRVAGGRKKLYSFKLKAEDEDDVDD